MNDDVADEDERMTELQGPVGGHTIETGMFPVLFLAGGIGLMMVGFVGRCGKSVEHQCWEPFRPAVVPTGLADSPDQPGWLKCRLGNPSTASQREVVVGNVRVQLLSPTLVRLEERGPKGFEDRCTFVIVDRDWPGVPHEVSNKGDDTVIDAGSYRVEIPGKGASLSGTKVLAPDGTVLFTASGDTPLHTFLPGPAESISAWVMGDMPRIIPPEWGATPPPSPVPNSGWDVENNAPDIYVFVPGKGGYYQLRSDFLKLTGPVEMPPLFTFGLWMSRYYPYTEGIALATIDGFRKRGIPLDLLVVDTDWRIGGSAGYAPDPQYFPNLERFFASAHEKNVRIMFNDHPEPQGGALDPDELQFRYNGLTGLMEQGLDVWWYDRNWFTSLGEPAPGISKEVWGMRLYHDITGRFRPDRRPLIMSNVEGIDNGILKRPSSPAAHRFPIWWTGDTRATWGFLKRGIENGVLSGVLSLLPYVNEDAGGHMGDPGPELYTRFMQFASLSPVTRPHCTRGEHRLPWEFGPEAEKIVKDYILLRYRLLPTIYSAARRAYDDGTPLMRRLDLEWPEYEEASDNTQYMFGDDLLIAPIHGNPPCVITSNEVKTPTGEPGFLGEYFKGTSLSGEPVLERIDDKIDFNWGSGEPAPGLPANKFSVRWTGLLGPVGASGEALFAVTSDDGIRLWVDDKLVLDKWIDQPATEWSAKVNLEAGRTYLLRLEYYENGGGAVCQLRWRPPAVPRENSRSVWLPPGIWNDAWTGEKKSGPAVLETTSPLWHTPMFVRDGGIIATIPQIEYTTDAVWRELILDVYVQADSTPARTERFIYEDDGVSPAYRHGAYSVTPVVLERNECGARLVLGPTAGEFPERPLTRTWVVRMHFPPETKPNRVTIDGSELSVASAPGSGGKLLPPAAGNRMPFAGKGSPPGPWSGPVLEIVLPDEDTSSRIEIRTEVKDAAGEYPVPVSLDAMAAAANDTLEQRAEELQQQHPPLALPEPFIDGCTGFPCANFSLGGEVTPEGELYKRIMYNPPVLGLWLEEWGSGRLSVETGGKRWVAQDFSNVQVQRAWPTATVDWSDPDVPVRLHMNAWAPVVKDDVPSTALPVLVARMQLEGPPGEPVALEYEVTRAKEFGGEAATFVDDSGQLDFFSDFGIGWSQLDKTDAVVFQVLDPHSVRSRAELALSASGKREVVLLLLFWHPAARAAADYADLPELYTGVCKRMSELESATIAFPSFLPASGDDQIDRYLRWYMTAGVMLTRVLKDDTTLTMGYAELNQRDSFWTSFMHMLYWPQAERKMLEESAAAVSDEGKVPTCILPLIEREDDIDINEYFLLRVARFYREYKDLDFLATLYPAARRAMQYLVGRCGENSALPEQKSFWADWKDVSGVTGRRFGPHFALLYLAALKEMAFVARELGDDAQADEWEAAYAAADEQVNLSVAEGGLWNGSYYVNIWYDGRQDNALLEDQVVAGVWGVIPPDRFASIAAALNKTNEQPWGVRETFPYYPAEEFGYEGGDYHNGAVWPWLNFADAIARKLYGFDEDARRLLRHVGQWDLEKNGDFLPHENLHGETGQGIRHYIQGWNAAYLEAVRIISK